MTGGLTRGLLRCAAAAALTLLFAVTGGVSTAFAHTQLVNSVPAAGASLERTPGSIQLSFTEPIDAQVASVVVVGPKGESLAVGPPRQSGPGIMQPITASREPGRIRVSYRVISLDGHPVSDSFTFTVLNGDPNAPVAPQAQTTPGAPSGDTGLSAGLLVGGVAVLALLVGGAFVARRRARPGSGPEPAVRSGPPGPAPSQNGSAATEPQHDSQTTRSQTTRPRP
jgi:copper resistance protein C